MTDTDTPAGLSGFHWTAGDAMVAAEAQRRAEAENAARETTATAIEELRRARRDRRTDPADVIEQSDALRAAALAERQAREAEAAEQRAERNAEAAEHAAAVVPVWWAEQVAAITEREAQKRLDHLNRQRALIGKPPVDSDGNLQNHPAA